MSEKSGQTDMTVLEQGARQMGVALSQAQLGQFRQYQQLLMAWNAQFNLTAVRDEQEIQRRHFLDSLSCLLVTGDLNHKRLVDVGTGAGFPGLPLRILFPDLDLYLVESVAKKASFLHAVIDALELEDVQIITARAESLGQNAAHRERYDWAVARAVASLSILIEYLLPLVALGGHMLAQKGKRAEEELLQSETGIRILGGGAARLLHVQIPGEEEESNLVMIEKIRTTPQKYPRRVGIPAKRPL